MSETPKYSIQASNGEHVNKDDSKDDRRDSSLVFESTEPQVSWYLTCNVKRGLYFIAFAFLQVEFVKKSKYFDERNLFTKKSFKTTN